jgi:hypothetical protein
MHHMLFEIEVIFQQENQKKFNYNRLEKNFPKSNIKK